MRARRAATSAGASGTSSCSTVTRRFGLRCDESAVESGEGEAGELVDGRTARVVAEGDADLLAQPFQRQLADSVNDGIHLAVATTRRG